MNMDKKELNVNFDNYKTEVPDKVRKRMSVYKRPNPKEIKALIPGTVVELRAQPGQQIQKGEVILILEAMKMRNRIYAEMDGTIKAIEVSAGEKVIKGQLLVTFE